MRQHQGAQDYLGGQFKIILTLRKLYSQRGSFWLLIPFGILLSIGYNEPGLVRTIIIYNVTVQLHSIPSLRFPKQTSELFRQGILQKLQHGRFCFYQLLKINSFIVFGFILPTLEHNSYPLKS